MQLPSVLLRVVDVVQIQLNPLIDFFSTDPQAYFLLNLTLLSLVALFFIRSRRHKPLQTANLTGIVDNDIQAIAGDDVVSTQLDLAKAYIEMNQKKIAKDLLNTVMKIGSHHQKDEARLLIQTL